MWNHPMDEHGGSPTNEENKQKVEFVKIKVYVLYLCQFIAV